LNKKGLDDVEALFTHLGIDPDGYRRFAKPATPETSRQIKLPNLPETVPAAKPADERSPRPKPLADSNLVSTSTSPFRSLVLKPSGLEVLSDVLKDRWRVLRDTTRRESKSVSPQLPFPPAIALHSVAGGGGVTTILATLSRALSLREESVLVADASEYSTLALYFGGRRLSAGLNTVVLPGAAPIYLRTSGSLDSDAPGLEPRLVNDQWLCDAVDPLRGSIERILFECSGTMDPRSDESLWRSAISLVVLVPDMRSAVGIRRVIRQFHEREQRLGFAIPKYFLLNKFDDASSLNVDMRDWFSQELGDSLLPFVIRRDEHVAEALAEGLTILDYAPDSAAAQDFLKLISWVQGVNN
jgi:cellulose synthase operon protein YhjQ